MSTDTYYKTKGDAVKWKQNIPSQYCCTLAVNITDVVLDRHSLYHRAYLLLALPVTCIEMLTHSS